VPVVGEEEAVEARQVRVFEGRDEGHLPGNPGDVLRGGGCVGDLRGHQLAGGAVAGPEDDPEAAAAGLALEGEVVCEAQDLRGHGAGEDPQAKGRDDSLDFL
jgi:hypothetical protein